MNRFALLLVIPLVVTGCTTGGFPLEPIPGSITYKSQPRTKLTRSPIGSTFEHRFIDSRGREVMETYRIEPDRSLSIVRRHVRIEIY